MNCGSIKKLIMLVLVSLMVITAGCIFDNDDNDSSKDGDGNTDFSVNGLIVMTTSVWGESGNTAIYDIETKTFIDNVLPISHDNVAKTDGDYLYILERYGSDAISKYDPSLISEGSHIYQYSLGEGANPHDIVFFDSKAYLLLYGSDRIWVVDPNAADKTSFKLGEIDISQWADADGSPEAHMGFVYNGMVYVVLQMYDLTTYSAGTPVLIIIDPATDTVMDMDRNTDGIQGVDLIVKNVDMGSVLNNILYLGGTTYGVSDEGVMKVDLNDPVNTQRKIISEAEAGGYVAGVEVFNINLACIYMYDENYNRVPRLFDPVTGSLGNILPAPDAGGGMVLVGNYLYVGVSEFSNPGMYVVDPAKNELVGDMFPTELQPSSIVFFEGNVLH